MQQPVHNRETQPGTFYRSNIIPAIKRLVEEGLILLRDSYPLVRHLHSRAIRVNGDINIDTAALWGIFD
jgi:hypothetical protein